MQDKRWTMWVMFKCTPQWINCVFNWWLNLKMVQFTVRSASDWFSQFTTINILFFDNTTTKTTKHMLNVRYSLKALCFSRFVIRNTCFFLCWWSLVLILSNPPTWEASIIHTHTHNTCTVSECHLWGTSLFYFIECKSENLHCLFLCLLFSTDLSPWTPATCRWCSVYLMVIVNVRK